MTKELFNINKAIAVADLVINFHKSMLKLMALYPVNSILLEPMLWNLKSQYESHLSLIKNARYEDEGKGKTVGGGA